MSIPVTQRYSVCEPTAPPTEVLATNDRSEAIDAAKDGQVVYDWSTGYIVGQCARCGDETGRDDAYGLCRRCDVEVEAENEEEIQ